jgi:hypothetical protein
VIARTIVACALAGLVVAAGCARRQSSEPPVAAAAFSVNHPRAPLGSPIEMTYRFTVSRNAKFDENYRAFVHFVDPNDEQMWTDDHDPAIPTTQWTPGQVVEYTRTVFIPRYPYVGEAVVRMGLYSLKTGRRLPLEGEHEQLSYKVGTIELLPQSEAVFLIYKEGWHAAEVARDNASVEWQWTKRDALLSFRNPRKDSLFYLDFDSRADVYPRPQVVTISIGDQTIDTFDVTSSEQTLRRIPIAAAQLGGNDMVDLKIAVDQTMVPAQVPAAKSSDPRELGIRVFHAYIEPRS